MIGIDIIEIDRIKKSCENAAFLTRTFSDVELEYWNKKGNKAETLAGMWAAKEAAAKACGRGFNGFRPIDIQIFHDEYSAPKIVLSKKAEPYFFGAKISVSISHNQTSAIAVCALSFEKESDFLKTELDNGLISLLTNKIQANDETIVNDEKQYNNTTLPNDEMQKVYTVSQIRESEKSLMSDGLVTEDKLIKRAAEGIFSVIAQRFSALTCGKIIVLCGSGNNGGDGVALAELLQKANYNVVVCLADSGKKNSERLNLANSKVGGKIKAMELGEFICDDFSDVSLVVDAIFGIGLNRPLNGDILKVVNKVKELKSQNVFVLSADIPSGINGDTGEVLGGAIKADLTVCLGGLKTGLFIGSAKSYVGKIILKEIGLTLGKPTALIKTDASVKLKERERTAYKNLCGKVSIIAGSGEMIGAAKLAHESAVACLRGGAGLVSLCVPKSLAAAYQFNAKEETLVLLKDNNGDIIFDKTALDGIMKGSQSVAIGMGLGKNPEIIKIIQYLAENFSGSLVIDADGLNALSGKLDALLNHKAKIILTPHIGEFNRICPNRTDDILLDAVKLAKELSAVLVVKSATTIITNGEKTYLNITGSPAMAKGGSGDVLAGVIAALSLDDEEIEAASNGCYIFGKAGEEMEKKNKSTRSVIASDLINCLNCGKWR